MEHWETLWSFSTARFHVKVQATLEAYQEWDGDGPAPEDCSAYLVRAVVIMAGRVLAHDYLGMCWYDNIRDFVTAHRDPDPLNRNSSIMRAQRGDNVVICHYFPGMVREVCREARKAISDMPRVRTA